MLRLKSVDLKKEKIETLVIPVCEDREIHYRKTVTALVKKAKKLKEFKTIFSIEDSDIHQIKNRKYLFSKENY